MDYEKIYDNLVSYRRENVLDESNCEYYETHHVIPRSIDKKLIYRKSNKVNLTVREHFVAHLLLKQIYKKKFGDDSYQYKAMVKTCFLFANKHKGVTLNSRTIEKLRIAYKKLPSPMKGKPLASHVKEALLNANLGKKHTKEIKLKIDQNNLEIEHFLKPNQLLPLTFFVLLFQMFCTHNTNHHKFYHNIYLKAHPFLSALQLLSFLQCKHF